MNSTSLYVIVSEDTNKFSVWC